MIIKNYFQAIFKQIKKKLTGWHFHLTLFFLTITIIGFALVSPYIANSINRPVSVVKVEGKLHHLSRKKIENQLSSMVSRRFFNLNAKETRKKLLSLPWVEKAGIRKQWPDTVWIDLKERKAAARWKNISLIDTAGNVFTPKNIDAFPHLPLLSGESGKEKFTWQRFQQLKKILNNNAIPEQIQSFTLQRDNDWIFELNNVQIRLGTQHHAEKIKLLYELYSTRLKSLWPEIAKIDFRYTNGVAVAWKKTTSNSI